DFRAKYVEMLPSEMNPNVTALEAARAQVQQISGRLQDAVAGRDSLRQEVENTAPMLVVESGGPNAVGAGGKPGDQTTLQAAEEAVRMMRLRLTAQHPDVIGQRKLIEALRAAPPEGGSPHGAKPPADGSAPGTLPRRSVPNPVYDQLKVKLIEAETLVGS